MTFIKRIITVGATSAVLGMSLTGSALATYDNNRNDWQDSHRSYNQDYSWSHDKASWNDDKDNGRKDRENYSWNHKNAKSQDKSDDKSCDSHDKQVTTSDKDIVDNAVNSQNLTTLVAAVQAAGLVETLKGTGPFTVFAPTNAAFDKLPDGTVDTLLLPENKEKLSGVLTYHVVAGTYKASDLTDGLTLQTVNGQSLTFTVKDGGVYINDTTKVESADTVASNGVIHVIDSVLSPK